VLYAQGGTHHSHQAIALERALVDLAEAGLVAL
jgi:cystathionine beta-lyase family protein involved in aluminum resistance